MAASNVYKYKIEFTYDKDGKTYVYNYERILSLIIDYDYENKNMPILLLRVGIDKSLLDHMISNENKTLILTIKKFDDSSGINIYKTIISGEFIYFLDSNLNFTEELDYTDKNNQTNEDVYKIVTMGLMKKDILINNKIIINTVYKDTYLMDIICDVFNGKNLVIEPLMNNKYIDNLIVQPITSLSKFLSYLDNEFTLYSTEYRLFFDFDKTYILSSSGEALPVKNEKYNTVFMYVDSITNIKSKALGMAEDEDQQAYVFYVDASSINLCKDNATNLSYNNIIAVDSEGNYKTTELNDTNVLGGNRYNITRLTNSNLNKLDNIKEKVESNKTVVNIIKQELDSSIFTINKEYYIKNYNKLADSNGKFLLASKREVYVKEDTGFDMTTIFTFKKCPSTN